MRVSSAGQSDVGLKREANEDFLAMAPEIGLFVVADGLGGHVAGRRASELGVRTFFDDLVVGIGELRTAAMRRALAAANAAILRDAEENPPLRGMGTTIAALWLDGDRASLVHVGDSRIYVLRAGKLHPLTIDHSIVSEMIARRELTAEAARSHPHRHIITRALGVGAVVEPDVGAISTQPGDVFVLCSDGISSQISDAAICELILEAGDDLDFAVQSLIAEANRRGGEDNATLVLARCD